MILGRTVEGGGSYDDEYRSRNMFSDRGRRDGRDVPVFQEVKYPAASSGASLQDPPQGAVYYTHRSVLKEEEGKVLPVRIRTKKRNERIFTRHERYE